MCGVLTVRFGMNETKMRLENATSRTASITNGAFPLVRRMVRDRIELSDLPLYRWSGCPAQIWHARIDGCLRLRQDAGGCGRCRHGCRQRLQLTFHSEARGYREPVGDFLPRELAGVVNVHLRPLLEAVHDHYALIPEHH